jgi:hypothetical protein
MDYLPSSNVTALVSWKKYRCNEFIQRKKYQGTGPILAKLTGQIENNWTCPLVFPETWQYEY